jgi:UDP-N-acetylglucosamine--N-acetylmuramyl-(pentapeptide) pyrophosphoryl-undecaprenol N-acetylglucosamine transferase
VVPYPLRFNDTSLSASKEKNVFEINAKLGEGIFSVHKKSLVIVGGSQGSAFLNKAIQHALETDPVLSKNVQIIHQAGGLQKERCNAWYQERRIAAYVFDFDAQIERYYQLADLVICRAGAGTLFELVHFNKRALVVPLVASTTAHQKDNAYAIAELYPHFFTVIEQQQLEMRPDLLAHHLRLGLGC